MVPPLLLLCPAVSFVNCSHIIIADILTAALLGLFCSANRTYVFFIYALPLKLPFTTQNYILRYLVLGPVQVREKLLIMTSYLSF